MTDPNLEVPPATGCRCGCMAQQLPLAAGVLDRQALQRHAGCAYRAFLDLFAGAAIGERRPAAAWDQQNVLEPRPAASHA